MAKAGCSEASDGAPDDGRLGGDEVVVQGKRRCSWGRSLNSDLRSHGYHRKLQPALLDEASDVGKGTTVSPVRRNWAAVKD